MGQSTRFASFNDGVGLFVPSLYAATNREAAAYESIFHDVAATARFKTVRLASVQLRSVSRIKTKKDLPVACLYAPDLKIWGIARTNLIETSKATYATTVLWAQALHAAYRDLVGLIWTSRQCDPENCLVFFGDRVKEADFDIVDSIDVSTSAALPLELRNFGKRGGITII